MPLSTAPADRIPDILASRSMLGVWRLGREQTELSLPRQPAQHERIAAPHETRRISSPIKIASANGTDSIRCQTSNGRGAEERVERGQ